MLLFNIQRIPFSPFFFHGQQVNERLRHRLKSLLASFDLFQIVNNCNEGARKMERMEEICVIQTQIEFKTKVRIRNQSFFTNT